MAGLGLLALGARWLVDGAVAIAFDIPVMIAVAFACLPIFFTENRIDRWEGAVFLFYYVAYTFYLILSSAQNHKLESFSKAMIWFVVPLTLLTLSVMMIRELQANRR